MTAEAAVVLPVLAIAAVGLSWVVSLGVAQVRVTDAAREVARALARGDPEVASVALGQQVAPGGARFAVSGEDTVTVRVTAVVTGPGGILGLPDFTARAEAVAVRESG